MIYRDNQICIDDNTKKGAAEWFCASFPRNKILRRVCNKRNQ